VSACRQLVEGGAIINAEDESGRNPLDLAQDAGHTKVVKFFEELDFTLSGGTGYAMVEAMADNRAVTQIEWCVMPLTSTTGRILGAQHSFLKITVGTHGEPGTPTCHIYGIEKATMANKPSIIESDIYISHWADMFHARNAQPIHCLDTGNLDDRFNMHRLYALAVSLGPYDAIYSNCHHCAMQLYNTCARPSCAVHELPNAGLIAVGTALQQLSERTSLCGEVPFNEVDGLKPQEVPPNRNCSSLANHVVSSDLRGQPNWNWWKHFFSS